MQNTGYKGWASLEEYFTDNGTATGVYKPNIEGDPDYQAPVLDLTTCPLPCNTTITFDPDNLTFTSGVGTQYVTIASNYDEFSFVATESWATYIASGSSGNITLEVHLAENPDYLARYCRIDVYHGTGLIGSINIQQN